MRSVTGRRAVLEAAIATAAENEPWVCVRLGVRLASLGVDRSASAGTLTSWACAPRPVA